MDTNKKRNAGILHGSFFATPLTAGNLIRELPFNSQLSTQTPIHTVIPVVFSELFGI